MLSRLATLSILLGLLLSALAPPATAGPSSEEWKSIKKEALKQLNGATDQTRIDAIMKIGGADCREAVDLLIKLLKRRSPEEDALLKGSRELEKKIDSIYARNKALLKKNMISMADQIEINKLNAQLNDITKQLNFLMRVKRKTSDALAKCVSQVAHMTDKGLEDKDWQVRLEVVQALAEIGTDPAKEAVLSAVDDKEAKVRAEVLEILRSRCYEGTDDLFIRALQDDWWQVRLVAIKTIQERRLYRAVGALILALRSEDGRLTLDIDDALKELTGKRYYGDAELWTRWWAANKEKFEKEAASGQVPSTTRDARDNNGGNHGGGAVRTTSFYGIKTASKRIIFILDISGSMREKAELKEGNSPKPSPTVTGPGAAPAGKDPAKRFTPKDDTKIEVAKCELKRAIANLPEDAFFNIIFYNHEIEVYREGMVVAKKRNKEVTYHYIDKMGPAGNTNIHDSLEKAFELVMPEKKNGKRKKKPDPQVTGSSPRHKKATRGGVDTIFFLTDGKPTAGRIVEPPAILAAVRLWNATRKIQIHTVGVGDHAKDFLERLAKQNNGTYVAR
ncbi:MAG: HEAT repeat domain-containing protein [Planctomycetota bacterium]|jgi:HEAT repeat protein